ncbi:hypothetical protein [Mycolicibacterium farcinogenes]|uniref:Uncharacterized protein n=1 Tax=Mycolicibacterium farcinogenes TaxID=1802 RepID=A0ACD1F9V3_MYCFR|nr:hypothetical protein [Mycolicibacterium farcinogenes]QZH63816.1 hypothetical protein K6L26_17190 [Mycolicibacterium farcinogenes]
MANDVNDIAAKLAKLYEIEPAQETEVEQEPEPPGKGNVIPSAGHQPDHVPTDKELIGLAEQAGDTEQSTRLKHKQLQKLIDQTYWLNP